MSFAARPGTAGARNSLTRSSAYALARDVADDRRSPTTEPLPNRRRSAARRARRARRVGWNRLLGLKQKFTASGPGEHRVALADQPRCRSSSTLRLHVPAEVVKDGLPAGALEFRWVLGLRVERLLHDDTVGALHELDFDLPAIADPVFDGLVGDDARVRALEVEALAAVFGFHARQKLPAFAQIDGASGRVPVILGGSPLLDDRRVVPGIPDLVQLGLYDSFNGDHHGCLLSRQWVGTPSGRMARRHIRHPLVVLAPCLSIDDATMNQRSLAREGAGQAKEIIRAQRPGSAAARSTVRCKIGAHAAVAGVLLTPTCGGIAVISPGFDIIHPE